jgi:hypothetical protein
VIVTGLCGEHIGEVERFEIDRSGRLKWLVVRLTESIGTRKRIAADHIRSIQDGMVSVAVMSTEIPELADDDIPDSAEVPRADQVPG